MGTGKEHTITITLLGLSQEEIERMIKEAEKCCEDKKRREVDAKNQADNLIYQTEKALKDAGDIATQEDKDNINKAKEALQEAVNSGNVEEIKNKSEALTNELYKLTSKMYQQNQTANAGNATGTGETTATAKSEGKENVVDADFEVKDDDNK